MYSLAHAFVPRLTHLLKCGCLTPPRASLCVPPRSIVCGAFEAKRFASGWRYILEFVHKQSGDGRLPPHSALVFSSGHHQDAQKLEAVWSDTSARDRLFTLARERRVQLIFQEHEPQHFEGGGVFDAARHKGRATAAAGSASPCEALRGDDDESAVGNASVIEIERRLVLPHLRAAGFDVLGTYAVTRGAWWAHTWSAPTPSRTADCTHYCMPGIPDIWASILLHTLRRPAHRSRASTQSARAAALQALPGRGEPERSGLSAQLGP